MMTKINSYKDLMQEKQRLQFLLQAQKEMIRDDIDGIKEELEPVRSAISTVSKFATRDHSNWLINSIANKTIDLLFRKLILRKAGWMTRLVVPYLLKNFSSHFVADHKEEIIGRLFSWAKNKFSSNGKAGEYHKEYPQ